MKVLLLALLVAIVALALLADARMQASLSSSEIESAESTNSIQFEQDMEDQSKAKKGKKGKPTKHGGSKKAPKKGKAADTCGSGLVDDCVFAAKLKCGSAKKCCSKISFGVDTNDGNTLSGAAAMHAAKVHYVGRYISQQATAPLPPSEVKQWHANHFKVFAVWEVSRRRPVEGGSTQADFANGVYDAKLAMARMKSYGAASKPVYFAVDSFVQPSAALRARLDPSLVIDKLTDIVPYFKGIRSVMNPKRVGAYGSFSTIKYLFDHHLISYGWQASSFDSGKRLDKRSHVYQCSTLPPDSFGSSQLDYDFALQHDFGQF